MEYAWLCSALLGKEQLFGPKAGLALPFLLRHGLCAAKRPVAGIGLEEWAVMIRDGECQFYLAAVDQGGEELDLPNTFFMLGWPLDVMVMGEELFQVFRKSCNFDAKRAIPIDPRRVSAHAWAYERPSDPGDLVLYQDLLREIGLEDLPGDDELMRRLCECRPVTVELPPMHLIPAPSLLNRGVRKERQGGRIVISLYRDATVCNGGGNEVASKEFFMAHPLIECYGFLMPRSAAPLFSLGSDCKWPVLACVKEVDVEWLLEDAPKRVERGSKRHRGGPAVSQSWPNEVGDANRIPKKNRSTKRRSSAPSPSNMVMATRQVREGAPILVIGYRPQEAKADWGDPASTGLTGWMFLHTGVADEDVSMCVFRDIQGIDRFVEEVID